MLRALRDWAPTYRHAAWSWALKSLGVDDPALAADLVESYLVARRAHHLPFPDARPAAVIATLDEVATHL